MIPTWGIRKLPSERARISSLSGTDRKPIRVRRVNEGEQVKHFDELIGTEWLSDDGVRLGGKRALTVTAPF